MIENKGREEKGITLVVLVITIIILLILAGMSIKILSGENGIISKALIAKEKNKIESTKEKLSIYIGKNGKGYYNDIFAPGWTVASLWELLTPGRAERFLLD